MSDSRIKSDAAFHTFDPEIAMQVGINAAVVYRNLAFWVRHNEANRKNFHEGRFWTYNSLTAFDEQFPYLTAKQIRTALDKLIEAGLIVKGHFHEDKFKRASWYALGGPTGPNGQMDPPQMADELVPEGSASAPEGKSIRNRSVPDSKPNPPPAKAVERMAEDWEVQPIWDAYPKDKVRDRATCRRQLAVILSEAACDELAAAAQAYSVETAHYTRRTVMFLDNWLRTGRWRHHVQELRQQSVEAEARTLTSEETMVMNAARWIGERSGMCRHVPQRYAALAVERGLITLQQAQSSGVLS